MTVMSVGRPTRPESVEPATPGGARGLLQDEGLIFERADWGRTGVDLPTADLSGSPLGDLVAPKAATLPGLTEPETMRHYVRLSQKNHAIDLAMYPLGSCTMKHNPRLNEKLARLPGFADIHPLQALSTVAGAVALMDDLAHWLKTLTGMPAVALSPKAGAHGGLCGILAIRAAHEARGDPRRRVLTPTSAHGTNPATAAFAGYAVTEIGQTPEGHVDLADLAAKLGPDVAAVMVTNPNTCGLFEPDMIEIARLTHAAGAYLYCDGANFNAIVGKVRPGDLGVDAMHINLHKTFSTPHGGGGPGAGPVVLSEALAPFAPLPWIVDGRLVEQAEGQASRANGRMCAFHGQMGMFVRSLRLHAQPRLRRPAAGGRGRRAQCQLRQGAPKRRAHRALRRAVHARGPVRRPLAGPDRGHHPGHRQGPHRRRLSPHDHVFPPGRSRGDADRAYRDGITRGDRSVRRRPARPGGGGESGGGGAIQGRAGPCSPAAAGRDRRRPQSGAALGMLTALAGTASAFPPLA